VSGAAQSFSTWKHRADQGSVTSQPTAIRPFRIEVPQEQLADLRRRIEATRWPSKELVADRSQGVQLETLKALATYWASGYDRRRVAARLNELPQFTTEIDGVEIHFIHVRSRHEDALPLIMTHGWPGSVMELLDTIGPLTDPTAHGGSAEDAFHLVLPSLPGYGFWVEAVCPGLAYFNVADRGGHFAAWEEPQLFSSEMRAVFRPLRAGVASLAAARVPPAQG